MKERAAFSLIEMSICLIIMGVVTAQALSATRYIQKHIQYQRHSRLLQKAEHTLLAYFCLNRSLPQPHEPITEPFPGILKGGWPERQLGNFPASINYYVDKRITHKIPHLRVLEDNRMVCVQSILPIPFVLEIDNQKVFSNTFAIMAEYFPKELEEAPDIPNATGEPEFVYEPYSFLRKEM
jgi:prepilin-type N-terminal cleavage/methylation domain-containing protein